MKLSAHPQHSLNAICPYFTMFPLEYPIAALTRADGVKHVLDPFCGRGTTLYAARLMGIDAWGVDVSPVAVAISRAKLSTTSPFAAIELAHRLLKSGGQARTPKGVFWTYAYHRKTLREICKLRAGLLKNRSEEGHLLRALILGALHGPMNKGSDGPSYLSNQMPRTFAAKPNYSVSYWKHNRLAPPFVDTLEVLTKRAVRLATEELPRQGNARQVVLGNAEQSRVFDSMPRWFDAVITSPPYYGMVTYMPDQWLRNWFLGGKPHPMYSNANKLDSAGPDEFAFSLSRVWENVGARLRPRGRMHIRFGSIPSRDMDPREILVASLAASSHRWGISSIRSAMTASRGRRQADLMRVGSEAAREYDFEVILK